MRTLLTLIVLLFSGCAASPGGARSGPPNVVLILADDLRPDAVGSALGYTPNLNALARSGTSFTRAVCPNPICVPSRVEILTGCTSFRNATTPRLGERPGDGLATWPGAMRAAGYHTVYAGKWHTLGKPRERGYEESRGLFTGGMRDAPRRRDLQDREISGYHGWVFQTEEGKLFPERGVGLAEDTDVQIADAAVEFIQAGSRKPYFLHVNFTSPHDPLMPPAKHRARFDPATLPLPPNFKIQHPFDHGNAAGRDETLWPTPRIEKEVRADLAHYYAAVAHVDEQVGRVLEALHRTNQAERTIVIFSSDHGLAIGSHGLRGKQNMYEHTVGVPMIFSGPDIPRGVRRSAQVYLRELFPTVCELTGVPVPPTVEGRSFARVLRGETDTHHDAIFGYFREAQRMIRTDRWKLIHYPEIKRSQLFDLTKDPLELDDAADRRPAVRDELRARLAAWQKSVGDPLAAR